MQGCVSSRIDAQFVIKVADFGLTEDIYAKHYFRQDKDAGVKLPMKWMAPESLTDGVFTEKTDVVRTRGKPCIDLVFKSLTVAVVMNDVVLGCVIAWQALDNLLLIATFVFLVVIWDYMLGDIQCRKDALPWSKPVYSCQNA